MRAGSMIPVVLAAAFVACGSGPAAPIEIPPAPPPSTSALATPPAPPRVPRATALEALRTAGTSPGGWLVVDGATIRDTRLATFLAGRAPFIESLTAAGVDPASDFDRVLFSYRPTFTLIQHHVAPLRVEAFVAKAKEESDPPGTDLSVGERACVELHDERGAGVLCPLTPELLIIASSPTPELLEALANSSGVDAPPAGEIAHGGAVDRSFYRRLSLPSTLGAADFAMTRPSGGLELDATFATNDSAGDLPNVVDAFRRFERWVHVDVIAERGQVRARVVLTAEETDALLALGGLGGAF